MEYANSGISNRISFVIYSLVFLLIFLSFSGKCEEVEGKKEGEGTILPEVLDLETAQKVALRENPSLKAVEHRIEQAKERVKQAVANYYPQLMMNYSATHLDFSDAKVESAKDTIWGQSSQVISQSVLRGSANYGGATGVDSLLGGIPWDTIISNWISSYLATKEVPEYQNNYTLNFVLRYTLFDGLSRKYTLKLARLSEFSVEESKKESIRLLLYAVANSYYSVLLAEENLRIAEADKAFNERLLYEAKAKYEKGAGALSDVLNFEVRLRAALAQIINFRQSREIARISLAEVMGLKVGRLPDQISLAPLPEDVESEVEQNLNIDELLSFALANRPDLKIAKLSIDQAEAKVGQSKSTLYPQVGVSLSHTGTRSADSEFRGEDFSTSIGLDVTYTLFAGGKYKAMRAEARALLREAEENFNNTRIGVITEVYTAYQEVKSALEQLKLQKETADYVRQNRDLVEKEFLAGQAPLVRLNEAQRDLVDAEVRLASARVGLLRALYHLKTTTGKSIFDFNIDN